MKLSNSYFYTLREQPKDEESISGNLLVRSGMIKKSSSGIYMILPLGFKVLKKIQTIIEEEMDNINSQQLLMPALVLEDIYCESGRRDAFGSNMFALKDRYQKQYVLAPTHEELFTLAAMMKGKSYKDFPYSLYQIQTKFRDETRPRFGLIRVREFIMKDAYSFDIDEKGLDISYQAMFKAYQKIFDRMELNYKIVEADTGAMGGLLSQEFQAISEIGEDILVCCDESGYASNLEIAPVVLQTFEKEEHLSKELISTPNVKTIEEVRQFFNCDVAKIVKTLLYTADGKHYAFLIKGDRELNETKALKLIKANEMQLLEPEMIKTLTNAEVGFAGPIGLSNITIVADQEVLAMHNFICGANQTDYHYKNVNIEDFTYDLSGDIGLVKESDLCPISNKPLQFYKGIEVGNTFKLGTKYSNSLGLLYADENNKLKPCVMGCYGIGLGRCLAAVVEQHHDENGIIWPKELAPFQICIVSMNHKDEAQKNLANQLYTQLSTSYEVLYDDRNERGGVKLKDMDLIGIPMRVVVGRKAKEGIIEFTIRGEETKELTITQLLQEVGQQTYED